jgi:site-specific recombinase XerC
MAPRQRNVLPKTKTPEEWVTFFGCIQTRYPTAARNHALLYLTYLTGLRIGETLALRMQDVDLDRLKVHVTQGKTGERVVPLPDDARLVQSMARWLRVRQVWSPSGDLLFITKSGESLRAAAVRRSMELYGQRSGIGHVTPHMLRHSAATEMLANGAPPIGVQRVLGHRSLRTTLETYAHACDTHAAEAMARRFGR